MRGLWWLTVGVLLAGMLGCGGGAQPAGEAAVRGVTGTEILIGGVAPLTGGAATYGISTRNAVQLYFDEVNAAGGVAMGDGRKYTLRFICEDDAGAPETAVNAFRKLIEQDRVFAIIGTVMSKCTLAGAPVAQAAKVVTISPASTNELVTKIGDYIFRACFIDAFQGRVVAQYAYQSAGARRAAIIYDNGNDYSKGLAETFKATFTQLGGQVVAAEAFTDEDKTTDFSAQLTSIRTVNPDIIFVPCYYSADALIAKQARGLGITAPLTGCDGWDSPELAKLGGAAVEGATFSNHYAKDDTRPEVQRFVAAYRAKYGEVPDALAALGYDAAMLLVDGIKRSLRLESAALREALAATQNFAAVSGRVTFDAQRNPVKSAAMLRMLGGKQVFVQTVNP